MSVMDQMVNDVMTQETMKRKGAELTPVGREQVLPRTAAPFPNDHPTEVIESAVKSIRREVMNILAALDAIDATNGVPAEVAAPIDAQKVAERAADAAAAARAVRAEPVIELTPEAAAIVERLKGAQQKATTFSDDPAMQKGLDGAWVCPTHGLDNIIDDKSPKGREYRRCMVPGCKQFEKGTR